MEVFSTDTDFFLGKPSCGVTGIVTLPLKGMLSSGKSLGVVSFGMPLFLFLDAITETLFNQRNLNAGFYDNEGDDDDVWMSWDDQQTWAIEWMEGRVNSYGLEGRACGMRFMCEMQHHPIHRFSIVGEALSVLFSLRNTTTSDVLQQYVSAQEVGKSLPDGDQCAQAFSCPISVFKLFGGSLNSNDL